MALKFEVIGRKNPPLELNYDWRKLALYALSVGANVPNELEYVYEKDMKIVPTYWASILALPEFVASYEYGGNAEDNVQFGFEIHYHKPLTKIEGKITYTVELEDLYDRGEGRGCLVAVKSEAFDEDGDKVFTLVSRDLERSAGGFGGHKPPKTPTVVYPDRAPDFEVEDRIGPNQAAIYRINNDKNILHIDPDFAKKSGFEQPIVMGMCTAGYACRALVHTVCGNKPETIKSFAVRFTSSLELDKPIKTQIWKVDDHNVVFRVINTETNDIVLNYGSAEI